MMVNEIFTGDIGGIFAVHSWYICILTLVFHLTPVVSNSY